MPWESSPEFLAEATSAECSINAGRHLALRRSIVWRHCFATSLTACSENEIPVEVMGYNHMSDWFILGFSVNGAGGPNLAPESGGGGRNCCIAMPERWRPGMKAHVTWAYDTTQGGPTPPPPQEAEVEIPEYTPQNLGNVHVHFYPNHQIKVVVSKYSLGHPLYPLPRRDWAPWTLNEDWTRNYYEDKAKGISR